MNTSRPEAGKTAHYSLTPAYVSIRAWGLSERSFNQFLAFLSINLDEERPGTKLRLAYTEVYKQYY